MYDFNNLDSEPDLPYLNCHEAVDCNGGYPWFDFIAFCTKRYLGRVLGNAQLYRDDHFRSGLHAFAKFLAHGGV